ncbi:non-homologous end-joining DNA ligase [Micromonospora sp. 4G57]|uniref:DNA ligase (ATP) n=2 Tax=Micromonosporaceae TaxID=28056 RepID=A0ABU5J5Q5_9ACTN|nr:MULTISPECIES: non-homologous end-joining DNA ligase [unclassified Micromonospora]MDZ5444910.1 non-homologous end-joining DNA ligase [Micromonospora sp. 4G57]MDZ5487930.1 non-homologous end-joining DNA ligase [Micromonospora sp. 4G53]
MPDLVPPMLASSGALPSGPGWAYEFKWDGVRAIAYVDDGVRLLSRNDRDVTRAYPELDELAQLLPGRRAVLDGEIVALDAKGRPSFSALQHRMHVRAPSAALVSATPVRLYLFDLLHLDGRDLTRLPYAERRTALQELGLSGQSVDTPPHWTGDAGRDLSTAAADLGLEGVVAKQLGSSYEPGRRSPAWVKVPLNDTVEVIVGGYKPGAGRRAGTIGSLLLGMYDERDRLTYIGHVGTGFTQTVLRDLDHRLEPLRRPDPPFASPVPREHARHAVWVDPVLVGDVAFRSWTPDRRLRHPSWKGLRSDREPAEIRLQG